MNLTPGKIGPMDIVIDEDMHGIYGLGPLVTGAVCRVEDEEWYAFVNGRRIGPHTSSGAARREALKFWTENFSRDVLLKRFADRTEGGFAVRLLFQNDTLIVGGVKPIEDLSWISATFSPSGQCTDNRPGWNLVPRQVAEPNVQEIDLASLFDTEPALAAAPA